MANLAEAALPFLRNIALAHLISPHDFGLAISFSIVLGMIEVLTDFGLPIYGQRAEATRSPDVMMGTLQSLAIVRGCVLALILLAVSPLMARLFDEAASPLQYAMLSAIPLVRAFENFGVKEQMRRFRFWPEAIVIGSSQVIGAVVSVAVAAVEGGFMFLVWGMLATSVVTVILSNLLSPRRFRLCWDREVVRDATSFGRPLLVNGVAVSLNLSDRLLVGSVVNPASLALYNVAYGTATLPRTVLAKFLVNAMLPLFVERRESGRTDRTLLDTWVWVLSLLAFSYGLALALVGDVALGLVFGAAYEPSRLFMCLAGLSVCVKFLMLTPTPHAYAQGRTRIVALGSMLSAASVAPAALLLFWTRDLDVFMLGLALSEFAALAIYGRSAMAREDYSRGRAWALLVAPLALLAIPASTAAFAPALGFVDWLTVCVTVLAAGGAFYALMLTKLKFWFRAPSSA